MTSNVVILSAIFDFCIFLKGREKTEINANSRQNAYVMYNFVTFCKLMKKTGETIQKYVKKSILAKPA